jgi:hypothetical protein
MRRSFANRTAWLLSFVMSLAIAPALFAHPGSGIAVDRDGIVYFTDTLVGVCKVDEAGKVHLVGGSAFHWMAIDDRGAFADAADSFGEWFERATPRRSTPTVVTCSDFPCTVGSDGNLYYAKNHQFTVIRRTSAGREAVLARHPRPEAWSVTGLARGPEGAITRWRSRARGRRSRHAPSSACPATGRSRRLRAGLRRRNSPRISVTTR